MMNEENLKKIKEFIKELNNNKQLSLIEIEKISSSLLKEDNLILVPIDILASLQGFIKKFHNEEFELWYNKKHEKKEEIEKKWIKD